MIAARLSDAVDLALWREVARSLLAADVPPQDVDWQVGDGGGLFDDADPLPAAQVSPAVVPRSFVSLADRVLAHRDAQRHALLYRLLWRLTHGEPALLSDAADDDVLRVRQMDKAVRRDIHKMHAFLRFREVAENGESVFVAWFEPDHRILSRTADFFVKRFAGMRFSILTPDDSCHWDGQTLRFGPGASRGDAPDGDALEELWRRYFASIFNPARLKVQAMKSEMPVRYWKNLPEARLIPELIRDARPRAQAMVDAAASVPRRPALPPQTRPEAPPTGDLDALRTQAQDCRRCELWAPATQTVFGEGPHSADILFVGEQPGDQEDLAGRPFIGPAGKVFDRALDELGIDRRRCYVTNTVKHFKFEPRGKRRLHARANASEQAACRVWLDAELASVSAPVVVALGAMAAQALFGRDFKLMAMHGQWQRTDDGRPGFATVHPSYLLRLPDEQRDAAYRAFVEDLRLLLSPTR